MTTPETEITEKKEKKKGEVRSAEIRPTLSHKPNARKDGAPSHPRYRGAGKGRGTRRSCPRFMPPGLYPVYKGEKNQREGWSNPPCSTRRRLAAPAPLSQSSGFPIA